MGNIFEPDLDEILVRDALQRVLALSFDWLGEAPRPVHMTIFGREHCGFEVLDGGDLRNTRMIPVSAEPLCVFHLNWPTDENAGLRDAAIAAGRALLEEWKETDEAGRILDFEEYDGVKLRGGAVLDNNKLIVILGVHSNLAIAIAKLCILLLEMREERDASKALSTSMKTPVVKVC